VKFKLLNSTRTVDIKINKYLIDWDTKVKRGKHFGQFQFDVKQLLRPHWEKKVILEEMRIPAKSGERGKSIDIVNLTDRICVECDGKAHYEQSEFFHRNKYQYFRQLKNDLWKENWSELNGFKLIRIYQDDTLDENLLVKLGII
jgi:very-short-patch-repair endonuclease